MTQENNKTKPIRVLYRIWIILSLAFFTWATFTLVRPWTSYISAMQNGVSNITYKRTGSYIVSSFKHTRSVQTEIEVADYTGNTPIIKKWSASELYVLTGLGICASILVLLFSAGLFRHYSKKSIVGLAGSSIGWYIVVTIGNREIFLLPPIIWLLCMAITTLFAVITHKRRVISVAP